MYSAKDILEGIYRAAPIGIGIAIDRKFVQVNAQMCRMLGCEEKELLGRSSRTLYQSDDEYHRVGMELYPQIEKNGAGSLETRIKSNDGRILDIYLSAALVDPGDIDKGILFTATDISDRIAAQKETDKIISSLGNVIAERTEWLNENNRKLQSEIDKRSTIEKELRASKEELEETISQLQKTQSQIIQSEKMASIGQLAAGVAHEINNPLSVISCYSNLIEKSGDATEQIREDLEKVKKHTLSCKRIVDSLLNFARVSETRRRSADIHSGLESVLAIFEKQVGKRQVEIRRHYASSLPPVSVDEDKMAQVYMNVLLNAVQAIDDQGTVTIHTAYDRASDAVRIRFSDTGPGIPAALLGRIFDPFFTTKKDQDGTGLGLSVSYGIVQEHDGDIQVESRPGHGSVFTVILPAGAEKFPGGDQ